MGGWVEGDPAGDRRFLDLPAVALERGGRLPGVRVAYETWGTLAPDGGNAVLVVVNLDPFSPREATVRPPLEALGIGPDEPFQAHELITDQRHLWTGPLQRVRLDPAVEPAAIFRLDRLVHRGFGSPCY